MTGEIAHLAAELPRYEDNIRKKIADILAPGADEVGTTLRETRNQVMALSQLHASLAFQPSPNPPLGP
jgi:hypothetical protein